MCGLELPLMIIPKVITMIKDTVRTGFLIVFWPSLRRASRVRCRTTLRGWMADASFYMP